VFEGSSSQVYNCYQGAYAFPDGQSTAYSFEYRDPSGAWHYFAAQTQQPQPVGNTEGTPCQGQPQPTLPDVPTSSGYAIDGSGYSVNVTNYTSATVYDASGTQVYPSIVDRNGNNYSTDANGNLIDSIGRTPVLQSSSGNQTFYDVLTVGGGRARYTVTTTTINAHTGFNQSAVTDYAGQITVVSSIGLPDGSSYQFTYDSVPPIGNLPGYYGELKSVTLPTGGTISYTYTNYFDSFQNVNRWLNTRVKDGGTTTYTPSLISFCSSGAGCQEKVVVTTPVGDDTAYTFNLDGSGIAQGHSWNTNIAAYQGSASGGTALRSTSSAYSYQTVYAPAAYASYPNSANVPVSLTQTNMLNDVGLTSKTVSALDYPWGNPTSVQFWDYYSGSAPSSPTQTTTSSYVSCSYCELPSQTTISDGSGNTISQTTYGYDETTGSGHAPLVNVSGLPQQPVAEGVNRGNLTTTTQWVDASGTTLSAMASYDTAGMVRTSTDPNGTSNYRYDSTGAFVAAVTPPTPSSGVSLASTASTDSSTGLPSTSTDANGATLRYQSYDGLNRLTEMDRLDQAGNLIGKQTYVYSPAITGGLAHQGLNTYTNSSASQDTETQYDSYGRVSRVAVANGQSANPWYQTDTCYDTSGNKSFQSYPYAGQGWSTAKVCSGAGDSYNYAFGRVQKVTRGDGTTIQYAYTGRATKVTDENGVSRISQVDGLGRMTDVCEISSNSTMPGGSGPSLPCGLDVGGSGFITHYAYDSPHHTTTITQGGQQRTFQTDATGRSIQTNEPERGITNYSYAYNSTGLVVTRTRPKANQPDARILTTTTSQYDSLGRVVGVQYSDGTPGKEFKYDAPASYWTESPLQYNMRGRLSLEGRYTAGVGYTGTIYSYDASGNVIANYECEPASCGNPARDQTISYGYDWAGTLTSESDGAGAVYTYARSPAGEVTGISSSLADATDPANIVIPNSVQNGPFGPTNYLLGNGTNQVLAYDGSGRNINGWVCNNGSTAPQCGGSGLLYGYGDTWKGHQITWSGDTSEGQLRNYGYDEFDRLSSMSIDNGQTYQYIYDRWGNRWQQNAPQGGLQPQYSFDVHNQVGGLGYDAAGNLTNDGLYSYTYDADGNVTAVNGGSTASYVYDSLNRRTRIQNSSGIYEFAFDAAGRRTSSWNTAGYGLNDAVAYWDGRPLVYRAGGSMHFQHQDWLGTERARTSYNGSLESTFSSLPFGDGYAPSGPNGEMYHFAALDFDLESNTSHAQFRQMSSTQGRWMSPDPYNGSYDLSNPQSFNRYSYVGNMPLNSTDPSGLLTEGPAAYVGTAICGPACGLIAAIGAGIGELAASLFAFSHPTFHGSLQARPSFGPITPDGNGGYTMQVSYRVPQYIPPSASPSINAFSPLLLASFPASKGALPDPTPIKGTIPGTSYCGPGGSGTPTTRVDATCALHDKCYQDAGISFVNNVFGTGGAQKQAAARTCNAQLCSNLSHVLWQSSSEMGQAFIVGEAFGCAQ